MKIPSDAVIARDKLTNYLLVFRRRNDKSRYLAQAGFTQDNTDALEAAIRRLVAEHEAISDRQDVYGVFYQAAGDLRGPHGTLPVVTIWIRQHVDGVFRFITLKPAR